MTGTLVPLVLALVQAASPSPRPAQSSPGPSARPAPAGPVVALETSFGKITIGLYKQQAPVTVDNFLKYVRSGHYDGTTFHRVIANFMIQGGGYDATGAEHPTRPPIKNEAKNGLRNSRGAVAMARGNDPDSAEAQFFINVKDNHNLDYGIGGAGYCVFGEVLEGMDVVDKIKMVPTGGQDAPQTPVLIKTVREVPQKP